MDFYKKSLESLGLHEVTCWFSFENGKWVFNHADLGHTKSDSPHGKTSEQNKAWKGKKWSKRFCYGDTTRWPMLID